MPEKTVTIFYNGSNPFLNQATPLVEISSEPVRYGARWTNKEVIKLSGGLLSTSCSSSFTALMSAMTSLRNSFSSDFKILEIKEDGATIFSRTGIKVASISFPEDKNVVYRPYEITLEHYDLESENQAKVHGVIDPNVSVEYSEGEDGVISINVSASAKGIFGYGPKAGTTSNAILSNAVSYVTNEVDSIISEIPPTANISGFNMLKLILISESENINRLDSSYSLSRSYKMSPVGSVPFLFRHSLELSYNEENGVYDVSVSGEVSGGLNEPSNSLSELRDALSLFKPFDIARSFLMNSNLSPSAPEGLNPNPLSISIDESIDDKKITFNYSYNSDVGAMDAYFEYDSTVQYADLENVWSISLSGTIKGRKGQAENWTNVQSYYNGLDLRNICRTELAAEGFTGVLEDEPSSYSATFNEREAQIQIKVDYKQKKLKISLPLKNVSYSLSVERPLYEKKILQTWNNGLKVQDINCLKRGKVSISGTGEAKSACDTTDATSQINSFMEAKLKEIAVTDYFLEDIKVSVSSGEGVKKYDFNASASFEEDLKYDNK